MKALFVFSRLSLLISFICIQSLLASFSVESMRRSRPPLPRTKACYFDVENMKEGVPALKYEKILAFYPVRDSRPSKRSSENNQKQAHPIYETDLRTSTPSISDVHEQPHARKPLLCRIIKEIRQAIFSQKK